MWEFAECVRTSNDLDLGDTVGVSEDNTDLGWSCALLCELADLVDDLLRGGLEPRRRSARVWDGRGRYALSVGMKSTHFGGCRWSIERIIGWSRWLGGRSNLMFEKFVVRMVGSAILRARQGR